MHKLEMLKYGTKVPNDTPGSENCQESPTETDLITVLLRQHVNRQIAYQDWIRYLMTEQERRKGGAE